ncbi:hypothetical protein C8Q76DRAFT_804117 [Earliella scabrosa]|nr:hypothetical protein C8Q76DRAFT_804117 [Earliella scabrosa]
MVFGFFSRKPQPPPETVPLPPSPSASTSNQTQSPGTKVEKDFQLRTPSPSVDSASAAHGKVRSASPTTKISRLSIEERQSSPTRRGSISGGIRTAVAPNPEFVPPEPTPDALPVLSAFFSELAPPQRLHCVRCHKDYAEVENDDRSCLVPHDDESAEVERVGTTKRPNRVPGTVGTTFETLWGCCGKIVEGDGDQGPPDGWCYEGKHTTDIKRARFRADSTPHDDKLVSCLRLNCHGIRAQLPRGPRSMRKRPRSMNLKEASTDDDEGSEGGTDSGMDEIVGKTASTAGRGRKGKGKAKADDGDRMDVDESASVAGSVRSRGRPPKSKAQQAQTPGSAARRRVRVTESRIVPGTDGEDEDATSVRSAPTGPAKRRGRPPKSKAEITDSDREMAVEGTPSASKGKEKARPRPRSLSRTRPGEMSDASVTAGMKPKSRAKKAREANARDLEAEGADGDDEKPKKRRKVVNA